jgi:hypothetical protein
MNLNMVCRLVCYVALMIVLELLLWQIFKYLALQFDRQNIEHRGTLNDYYSSVLREVLDTTNSVNINNSQFRVMCK